MSSGAVVMDNPDTHSGISNAKLAVWLFLASEIMLFATLFTSYIVYRTASTSWPWGWDVFTSYIVYRTASTSWPWGWDALNVPLATLNTVILIASSVTIVMAYARCHARDAKGFRLWMAATLALSFGFLVVKAYFTMTGLHGIHILGGILLNSGLLYMSFHREHWDNPLFLGRVEGAGLYWHFVDLVWIFLFPAIYLL
jgi:cytochrome c oxidase subunit III